MNKYIITNNNVESHMASFARTLTSAMHHKLPSDTSNQRQPNRHYYPFIENEYEVVIKELEIARGIVEQEGHKSETTLRLTNSEVEEKE